MAATDQSAARCVARLCARAEQLLGASSEEGSGRQELRELVSELQVHQVELERSREKYLDLFEHAPLAYLRLDAEGTIEEANRAATLLLGMPRERLVGAHFIASVFAEHAERFEQHRRSLFDEGGRQSCELELQTPAGRSVVRLESALTSGAGAWRMALVDMTEVRKLERALQQAQRLEAIATLVSGVAHDFNNLLMAVLGCSEIALAHLEPGSAAHSPIAAIRESALRGRGVVGQLLTFARGSRREHEVLVVDEIVSATVPMLKQALPERIELRCELAAPFACIRADAGQLQQIVLNLATNAQHAMPDGGILTLATSELAKPEGADERPRVRLTVRDTGVGMDANTAARAFEPFFTTKPPGVGTGLGLSMVYGAVQEANGRIELDSRPGAGTRVSIDWPLERRAAPRDNPPSRAVRPGTPLRVLVVEDDRLVRLTLRHYLETAGYQVFEAPTGEDAVAQLEAREHVDVLVTDVVLPGLKGPQVEAAARASQPEIGVVLVSGHGPELLVQRGLIRPGTAVLQKPFTAEALRSAVERARAKCARPEERAPC